MRRHIIPYEKFTKVFARKLRNNSTYSEIKLWNELKRGKIMQYDFDRQRRIGKYIVDFYCKDLKLAIEVDGITHHGEEAFGKDIIRQTELGKSKNEI